MIVKDLFLFSTLVFHLLESFNFDWSSNSAARVLPRHGRSPRFKSELDHGE